METASLATIEYASKYKDSLLMNRYRAGRDQIASGSAKAPYAYVVTQNQLDRRHRDRKSTRLNSSHANISYAVFCLKKKKTRPPPLAEYTPSLCNFFQAPRGFDIAPTTSYFNFCACSNRSYA